VNRIPVLYSLPMRLVINHRALSRLKDNWVFPPDILAKASEAGGSSPPLAKQ